MKRTKEKCSFSHIYTFVAASSTHRVLTRMAVQCADGYDVATITSYDDINNLYNRFIFPTNVSMVINNFNMSGDNNFLVTINQKSAF